MYINNNSTEYFGVPPSSKHIIYVSIIWLSVVNKVSKLQFYKLLVHILITEEQKYTKAFDKMVSLTIHRKKERFLLAKTKIFIAEVHSLLL